MTDLSLHARRLLVGIVGRVVAGGGLEADEIPGIERDLGTMGFRKAVRGLLLRRMARDAIAKGGMTVLCRPLDGRFTLACPGDDLGVGWEILQTGNYEPHVAAYYARTLEPGMTVVDVGANIGFHALHAASRVMPGGRVLAVEPDPRSAAMLRLAARLDDLAVEVIEAALSDAPGELILSDLGNPANSGARFTHEDRSRLERLVHGPSPTFRTVEAVKWDDRYLDVPLHLVKLDVEGFEPRAVRGMEQSIERHRPIVVSEFAPSNLRDLGETDPQAYLAWFLERGYRRFVIPEEGNEPVPADDRELASRLAGSHHVDLVFLP